VKSNHPREYYIAVRDGLPYLLNNLLEELKTIHTTFYGRLLAYWWNVNLGNGCKFIGVPYFRKHPNGEIHIGKNCIFRSSEWSNSIGLNRRCFISAGRDAKILIGNSSGFSATIISAAESIKIGDYVLCGANCTIVDNDRHPVDALSRRNYEPAIPAPIVIEDDVFLGMNTIVLKGVTIGRGTIVAANSVVTVSLPENVIAGGTPARIIRSIA